MNFEKEYRQWKRKILVLSNIFHKYDFLPAWRDILAHQGPQVFKFISHYARFHKNNLYFTGNLYNILNRKLFVKILIFSTYKYLNNNAVIKGYEK